MQTLDPAAYADQLPIEATPADPFSMEAAPPAQLMEWEPRSPAILVPYVMVLIGAAISWMVGGLPRLTDLTFLSFTLVTATFLIIELIKFPRRFGVGALIVYGGTLIWFCHDYFDNWFMRNFLGEYSPFDAGVVAKAAFFHILLVASMVAGLFIPGGKWLQKLFHALPEPSTISFYLILALGLFLIGLSPYFIWAVDAPHVAIYKSMTGGYSGQPAFTAGRIGGNINISWGGYIVFILEMGKMGAILAMFYAILLARSLPAKVLCWAMWSFWVLMSFGSGIRGEILYMVLPVAGLLYLKYQSLAVLFLGRYRLFAYMPPAILLLGTLFAVQFVAVFRSRTYVGADLAQVDVLNLQGNHMFSESLSGFRLVGETVEPFNNTFTGAAVVRPVIDTTMSFFITPIPRALWPGKPVDAAEEWYNKLIYGRHYKGSGNVSHGAAGYWYFRYGAMGIIEGGLLLGWLLVVTERSIRNSGGRPMSLLISMAIAVWLFRCFRGFSFVTLHPVIVGSVALWLILRVQRLMRGPGQ